MVLDRTPFYAEQGGQVADIGFLAIGTDADAELKETFTVTNTQVFAGYVVHVGTVAQGQKISVGDKVVAKVDYDYRSEVAPNHTMTHMLNFALRQVCSKDIDQKGSWVGADKLRFDFNRTKGMTTAEVQLLLPRGRCYCSGVLTFVACLFCLCCRLPPLRRLSTTASRTH